MEEEKTERKDIIIVAYEMKYHAAFKAINEEWISTHFQMEQEDYNSLENPQEFILNRGGKILVALLNNKPVGVCALIKMKDSEYDFEMAKMAVSPEARGKKIGWLLGIKIIETAKAIGAKTLYLESNTILKPAISLYYKLGFEKIVEQHTAYKRCNIQMKLELNNLK
ncbi:hypothetical protein GCM10022246_10100 [Pedobacter ginsengiterrae]|uniref:N-acetyltransferase domain-containing protein n=1 Tax=Pedobacter ginsengiterrae TaxID=871696 RepID=A0ABP7P3I2_9SPHI